MQGQDEAGVVVEMEVIVEAEEDDDDNNDTGLVNRWIFIKFCYVV